MRLILSLTRFGGRVITILIGLFAADHAPLVMGLSMHIDLTFHARQMHYVMRLLSTSLCGKRYFDNQFVDEDEARAP